MSNCQLCGEFYEQGRLFVAAQGEACNDCICNLIDNEIEKRGEREEARRFAEYHSGSPTMEDRERQQLKDAGRIP